MAQSSAGPIFPLLDEDSEAAPRILTRAAYAEVILRNGQLVAWLRRNNPNLLVFLPAEEPERSQVAAGLAHFLCARGQDSMRNGSHQGVLITTINGLSRCRTSHGPLSDGCRLSARPARHASAPHSARDHPSRHFNPGCSARGTSIINARGRYHLSHRTLHGPRTHRQAGHRFPFHLPLLTRFNDDTPFAGQLVESVESRGKWLLIYFSGGGTLATHMLMSGSWHIYRPGEKWQKPASQMRIVLENSDYQAVGFHVPVARMHTPQSLGPRQAHSATWNRRAQRRIRRDRSNGPYALACQ